MVVFRIFIYLKSALYSSFLIIFAAAILLPVSYIRAEENFVKAEAAPVSEKQLLIGGTGASLGGIKLLASAFMEKNPQYNIRVLPSLGSGGGIKALIDRKIQLALSARPLKDKEKSNNIRSFKYAETPLLIASHIDNKTNDLTSVDLVKLYSGQIFRWSDGQPVRIIRRPQSESDIEKLQSISSDMNETLKKVMKLRNLPIVFNDQENANMLESLPGSIGAISLAQILSEKRKIKEIKLNGVRANVENLINGTYKYKKSFYFILPAKSAPLLKIFIEFVFSEEGRKILYENGHHVIIEHEA